MPTTNKVGQRYYRFLDALNDWRVACQMYDADWDEYSALNQTLFPVDGSKTVEAETVNRFMELTSKVRFDIRCFYVFGKIAFVTYGGLLFNLAREPSQDWRQVQRFAKRVKRPDSAPLLRQFNLTFGTEIDWFVGHVNLYRNDFIEHPSSTSPLPGLLKISTRGAQICGLTGSGFSTADLALLAWMRGTGTKPALESAQMNDLELSQWLHGHFDVVPEQYREPVMAMFNRVGLESGDLPEVAQRMIAMFVRFIAFVREPLLRLSGGMGQSQSA